MHGKGEDTIGCCTRRASCVVLHLNRARVGSGSARLVARHDVRRSDRGVVQPNVGLTGVRALAALALFAIVAPDGVTDGALAQTPPTERELRIYAGLHDAAA